MIKTYDNDSAPQKMFRDLSAARDWSVRHKVPIFAGEFGSYDKFASLDDRCRHAEVIYSALAKLRIPIAWWEWDGGGFNMVDPGTTKIASCMRKAVETYDHPK